MKIMKIVGCVLALIGMWTIWVVWKHRAAQNLVHKEFPLEEWANPSKDPKKSL